MLKKSLQEGGEKMEKLKSRKFWMAVVSGLLIIANDGLDLGLPNESVMAIAAIALGYIFGEAAVDALKK